MIWVDDDKDGAHATKMGPRGHLDFFFPKVACCFGVFAEMQVDMPLNVVLASVFVPTEYRYGEFTVWRVSEAATGSCGRGTSRR